MAKARRGYERQLFYDSPGGATATTHIDENVVDVNLSKKPTMVETTDRGDGTEVPRVTQQPVNRTIAITATMRYYSTDTKLAALFAAEASAEPVAILSKPYDGATADFDGDCYVDWDAPGPLADGMIVTLTFYPTKDGGRAWSDS